MKPDSYISKENRQLASWLALFAMLMILVGPLIGQGAAWAQGNGSVNDHCMTMQRDSHHHQNPDLDHLLDACGYCSLFFHTPSIPQTHWGQPSLENSLPPTRLYVLRLAARVVPIFPGARSHAPPVRSFA